MVKKKGKKKERNNRKMVKKKEKKTTMNPKKHQKLQKRTRTRRETKSLLKSLKLTCLNMVLLIRKSLPATSGLSVLGNRRLSTT